MSLISSKHLFVVQPVLSLFLILWNEILIMNLMKLIPVMNWAKE
jgi:hypothetical protein